MSLCVEDFEGFHEANNVIELESVLVKRYKDSNNLWLSHGSKSHPALALLVRGVLAGLHYFPKDSHPGFVPTGNLAGLPRGAQTVFYISKSGEEIQVLNDAIVPFTVALAVAKEFFGSEDLPKSINWTEL